MSSKIAKRLSKVHQLEVPIWKEPDYICDALQRTMISKSKSPVTFCHNDLQEGNHAEFPVTHPSSADHTIYRGFDFANHFVEYSIDYDILDHPHYKINPENFPEEEQLVEFFVNYLREFGGTPECQLYKKAEELVKETLPFVPVSHFFWGVWGLLQVELSPVGFGFAVKLSAKIT
ncbi:hypothetical protein ANCCEY_04618 [Ancylostoma ceylanicum]|uniref:Choline/ethanolamine kinase n=1 Tax=Ancylostoma ceylanicum TaxID=53326 RepID=A0A0D6LW93_9BILA|nr:hypothetical protein ANCCEY_04618 [Ancylostoma ceylanicum]